MPTLSHNDQPIELPSQDRFGIDPFAATLAKSILKMQSPLGSVVALNGPWGSGKSSAVNLIRHHVSEAVAANEIAIINFACWWFRGEEALALAFFRELYAGLSPSLGDKFKKILPKLGARLLQAGAAIGGAVDAIGGIGVGAAVGGVLGKVGEFIEQGESVEKLHKELSDALAAQSRRFLIVIDDIDRLSPDEALLIFRLVKSVGRLPNVMYLLVYDRAIAEKIVSERYPSEGPHYLEKIVQAAFEIPEPMGLDVQNYLLAQINSICGVPPERERQLHFMNLFYEAVAPQMRTPRDAERFVNSLAVTWHAVAGDVDPGDFVALEVFRMLHPEIYRAIRQNKGSLCSTSPQGAGRKDDIALQHDRLFLGSVKDEERMQHRRALMRLFPPLESVWGNTHYTADSAKVWARERRVCAASHFDTYFRFTFSNEILSAADLETFIQGAIDPEFVVNELRCAVATPRASGGTKAAVILNELQVHADKIDMNQVQPLLVGLFKVADELDVEADKSSGFAIGDNHLRLHWLIRALLWGRTTLAERSEIFIKACSTASLGWLADFSDSAWADYHPREGREPEQQDQCLTTEKDAEIVRGLLALRLVKAAKDESFSARPDLAGLMYRWAELSTDQGAAVKAWAAAQIATDEGVRRLCVAFTSYGWSHGMGGLGDAVSVRSTRAQTTGLDRIMDVAGFRKRAEHLAAAGKIPEITAFVDAWDRQIQAGAKMQGRIDGSD